MLVAQGLQPGLKQELPCPSSSPHSVSGGSSRSEFVALVVPERNPLLERRRWHACCFDEALHQDQKPDVPPLLADRRLYPFPNVIGDRLIETALLIVARQPGNRDQLRPPRLEQRIPVRVDRPAFRCGSRTAGLARA